MDRIIVITHRDLDGIAGAALYTYCKKLSADQYKVVYVEPSDLLKVIRKYYKKGRRYVIIDIGINSGVYDELKDLDLSSTTIEWYDHHVWDEAWVRTIKSKSILLHIDRSTCATGVVANEACSEQKSDRIRELVEIVCGVDLWKFNRYESAFLFRYVDMRNDNSWRNNVLKVLREYLEQKLSDIITYVEDCVSRYVDEEVRVLSSLANQVSKEIIEGVKLCIYVKSNNVPSSSIIGNTLLSECDIAIIVHESLKSVSFRSSKCNVREIAKVLGGGGHPRASGARLDMPAIYRLFRNLALDAIKKHVKSVLLSKIREHNISLRSLCEGFS